MSDSADEKTATPTLAPQVKRDAKAWTLVGVVTVALTVFLTWSYIDNASDATQYLKDKDYVLAQKRVERACTAVEQFRNPTPKIGQLPTQPPTLQGTSLNGNKVNLAQYRGKWVFVNFWSTTCSSCKLEKPDLVDFAKNTDAVVLSVVTGDKWQDAKKLRTEKLPFEVINDPPTRDELYGPLSKSYGLTGYPETFAIAPDGQIAHHFIGRQSWNWIGEAVSTCGAATAAEKTGRP